MLDEGCVVGVPTDTVYAVAGSCKHPESIKNIYMVKVSYITYLQIKLPSKIYMVHISYILNLHGQSKLYCI